MRVNIYFSQAKKMYEVKGKLFHSQTVMKLINTDLINKSTKKLPVGL